MAPEFDQNFPPLPVLNSSPDIGRSVPDCLEIKMTFIDSIKTCFSKYAIFDGRAARSEFWWFMLFSVLLNCAGAQISNSVGGVVSLALLLPSLAVGARRLHDLDKSGWWLLLGIIPIANFVLIYWQCNVGTEGQNKYGPPATI